jgi:hypothetical protein
MKSGDAAMNKQDLLHAPIAAEKAADQAAHDEIERHTQAFLNSGGKIKHIKMGESMEFDNMTAKEMSEHRYNKKVQKSKRNQKNEHS